ncbi:ATP-binding protein [uncultured Sulfitobacter sp.]|uniref:ATP-binding protein n=1 Tax=uncultured Sulfitobacter sp. TaxID=191468 RepID=UPI00261E4A37|nr:ATP-binding protein [uncultured Sulfitobacter sp.]
MSENPDQPAELRFSHNVIEHLGIKLYKNKSGNVLAELLANSWDADSTWVALNLDQDGGEAANGCILLEDNGVGMDYAHIRDHYLHVGKPKRSTPNQTSVGGRRPMGRKGLGKLAPFGIARVVDVVSVVKGVTTWFTLKLDDILAHGQDGRYQPIFHAIDISSSTEMGSSNPYMTGKATAFRTKILAEENQSGTLICMSSIEANLLPDKATVAAEIGSRFTVVLLRSDFRVTIDGDPITEDDALPTFELRIPEGSGTTTEMLDGKEVRFWVGFVDTAEWSSDQAGVGVFAHGKIAQTRPYFFNKKGKEVFQRYLYAVVEADWIDEEEEDLISTDRTAIDWSVPKLQPLHDWGQKKVSSWISSYEKHRKKKQDEEVQEQAAELRRTKAANTYSKAENDQIDMLVSDATREIGKAKSAAKTREELLIAVSKAWINQPTRQFLGNLWSKLLEADASPEQIGTIVDSLTAHSVPEKMGLALTFSQRAFALTVLYDLVHKRSETDLQNLVSEFPWILQPRGDLLTADKTLKTTIDSIADSLGDLGRYDPGSVIKGMTPRQRADFVFLASPDGHKIQVVEIKTPELPLGVEQERQLVAYLDFIKAQRSDAEVSGILVGNITGFDANDRRVVAKSWSDILLECRASYVDQLVSMLDVADIDGGDTRIQAIRDFGGERVWDLLQKLSETDESLKTLLTDYKLSVGKLDLGDTSIVLAD